MQYDSIAELIIGLERRMQIDNFSNKSCLVIANIKLHECKNFIKIKLLSLFSLLKIVKNSKKRETRVGMLILLFS